ncbi:lipid-transfer protein [Sporosarcina sp. P13]|uniref:lipid-transfer protein n=1 Tax=Sporosarcina sp. P13 TaxID=2048263 RepID=UPI000C163B5A|nr:lipid-transfer protein [Sporosarcina sp. P13]PIC64894.1 lipid-transfer protein [Sporosarcina sp. P13]
MKRKIKVIGVDMVKFVKPGMQEPYEIMASKAIRGAIKDAGINFNEIESAFASYSYGDSTSGQTALYKVGMTGIPVFNVNNNCSSGSTALYLARQAVENGVVECALAFGFEEMQPGALGTVYGEKTSPIQSFEDRLDVLYPGLSPDAPRAAKLFGSGGNEYIEKYGANPDIFAKVAVKTRSHAIHNPYSMFDKPLTVEEVQNSPMIFEPYLTRYCACPPSCGAAAVIVCSEEFANKHGHKDAVEIIAQAMATDNETTFNTGAMNLVGQDMTRRAANAVYEQAGIGVEEVDVVELHDCFTPNEVITYEGLGLCGEGEAEAFINNKDNTYGGKYVVNPSGGLMSKGHPIGATGLAQCTELVWHLRGTAGERQVDNARVALQHNLGLGGAVVVTMYRKP